MLKNVKVSVSAIVKFEDGHDNIVIKADSNGLACLTDLWKKAKSPSGKRPVDWLGTKEAIEFVQHIKNLKGDDRHLMNVKPGKGGGTFADLQIALKYAQHLTPSFQKKVNDVYIQRVEEEIDPELGLSRAISRLDRKMKALGRDDTSVLKRLKTVEKRNSLTAVLADHGVKGDSDWRKNGFIQVTNAMYMGWKGTDAKGLRAAYGIGPRDNPRDHFDDFDLDTCAFIDSMTAHKVTTENTCGAGDASNVAHRVGRNVGRMVESVMTGQITPA